MSDIREHHGDARDFDQSILDRLAAGGAHVLVVMGYTGLKRCYLDLTWEECRTRYMADTGTNEEDLADTTTNAFVFDDAFSAYEAWSA